MRAMGDGGLREAFARGVLRKDFVHEAQHFRHRAARGFQTHIGEILRAGFEMRAVALEFLRLRALEGEDGLLLVAHREDGAHMLALAAFAGEHFLGQRLHDLPLFGAGVLRFVDEDVIEAAIQLVENPRRIGAAVEKLERLGDEVVVIEHPAQALLIRIDAAHVAHDHQRRMGKLRRARRAATLGGGVHAIGERDETLHQIGSCIGQRLGGVAFVEFAFLREQRRAQDFKARDGIGDLQRLRQCEAGFAIGFLATGEPRDQFANLGFFFCQFAAEIAGYAVVRFVLARAMRALGGTAQGFVIAAQSVEEEFQFAPIAAGDGIQNLIEPCFARLRDEMADGLGQGLVAGAGAFQNLRPRFGKQFARRLVVQHAEGRRHARFQRKAREQPFAEGVDGLDFQAAWRFQRARKQAAGFAQAFLVGRGAADILDGFGERRIVQHRPAAELFEQTSLHLRGGGLRVGEAKDFRGRRIRQQQARHAVGERVRLSRAGIGGDPCRFFRIGGDFPVGAVAAHCSLSHPVSDHSRTRAR